MPSTVNLVATKPETARPAAPRPNDGDGLAVEGLAKAYRLGETTLRVLEGVTLDARPRELVAIMGPSGSGKTTLLNCLAGIDVPDAGTVRIAGASVDYRSERARTLLRRRQIGMVFQFFNLIPTLTVRENVALPLVIGGASPKEAAARADPVLDRVGLGRRKGHAPFQLSGGEMQLASIARALVHDPEVVLADEPTGNLNPAVGAAIMDTLRATAHEQNATVILVTHSPEHAAWADRVFFLKDGVMADCLARTGDGHDPASVYQRLLSLGI